MSEIDIETRHAMDVIVRSILRRVLDESEQVAEMWGDYPEIGEHDWIEICEQVNGRAQSFSNDPEVYKAAYAHLASRAEH